jgi:hypothetical protein
LDSSVSYEYKQPVDEIPHRVTEPECDVAKVVQRPLPLDVVLICCSPVVSSVSHRIALVSIYPSLTSWRSWRPMGVGSPHR